MPAIDGPAKVLPPRTVMITACSGMFYDHYLDLLDSMAQIELPPDCQLAVIDLGLEAGQVSQLYERGVQVVPARWPLSAPKGHDRIEYVAFAGKPFAREFFPGYDMYVWMDADLWVQTPAFWEHLIQGAMRDGIAVPAEQDPNYAPMRSLWRLWMLRHYTQSFGIWRALRLMKLPVLNNGLFAARADAPHWDAWQKHFERMVVKGKRMIAIDQLALIATLDIEQLPCTVLGATDNWVCSLAIPWWDSEQQLFIRPGPSGQPISVMHLTTPSRERMFDVPIRQGGTKRRYLYRPGGHVMEKMGLAAASSVN